MKILITGGGTVEKIDEMRVITNQSSGRTSILLAEKLAVNHDVTLLLSQNIHYPIQDERVIYFDSVDSLLRQIQELSSSDFDIIIHAAAVGDYTVASIEAQGLSSTDKIPSGLSNLTIKLKPTKKIINEIKRLYPQTFLVGFKLTADLENVEIEKAVMQLIQNSSSDLVVHNKIHERKKGLDHFYVYNKDLGSEKLNDLESLGRYILEQYQLIKGEKVYDTLS